MAPLHLGVKWDGSRSSHYYYAARVRAVQDCFFCSALCMTPPPMAGSRDRPLLLARILETPHIERIVPQLQPELLHRVIQTCGLEDCADLVAMATAGQLQQIFDRDLWQPVGPGLDERLDADRCAVWLDVLMESGAAVAARKVAALAPDLIIAALAQHIRVFDLAATERAGAEIGGYRVESVRSNGSDTIVQLLVELEAEHPTQFHVLMRGCRSLSDSGAEPDGFHDLLNRREQDMFDLAAAREERRDKQGYVTPAQAQAFLHGARTVDLTDATPPPRDAVAAACLSALERTHVARTEEPSRGFEVVIDLLRDAGVVGQPRALLGSGGDNAPRAALLHAQLQRAFERDPQIWSMRAEELAFLANALLAGCSIQGRPFTPAEASDAAAAICNLGLERWPPLWRADPAPAFLLHHDLVRVFQVGWSALYRGVSIYAAEQLTSVLTQIECADRDIQLGLTGLRYELSRHCRDGAPWKASGALDAIMPLDMTTWAALLALIAECPVMHAAIGTTRRGAPRTIDASAFEFISTDAQIAEIRAFLESLPERLIS